jgi:hypothetical protein
VKLKEGTGYVIEECDAKAGEVKFKQFVWSGRGSALFCLAFLLRFC